METLTIKPKVERPPYLVEAREAYDASLQRLARAILASREARAIWLLDRNNDEKKQKYADAREEHKAALAHIQDTRTAFREANTQFRSSK